MLYPVLSGFFLTTKNTAMKRLIFLAIILLCLFSGIQAQTIQPFEDGDRAVFLGNSITDGGHYHSYIWLYYMTRFPDMNLRIMNAGIGGDTAANMNRRLDDDVFSKKPTVLTVTFGMNDSGYMEYNGDDPKAFGDMKYAECYANYKQMEKRLQGLTGSRIVLMGSSPYDETAGIENTSLKGKNAVMERIVEFQKESAAQNGWEFLDLNAPMTGINLREQAKDPSFALCGGDRIHPDNDGHMVMAYLYLKAQGFAGREVADVEIDASKANAVKTVNAEITGIKKNGSDIGFDYLAGSLPYPMDTAARGWGAKYSQSRAAELVPFIDEMNREILTVKGLKGDYKLFIDGEETGVWSGAELAAGINLALLPGTPQYRQALAVMYLNEYRWEIERTFREYAWIEFNFFQPRGLLFARDGRALDAINAEAPNNGWVASHRDIYSKFMHDDVREAREREMELLISKIYEVNKPVKRKIELHKIN